MFLYLYIFICTRSMEQMGCGSNPPILFLGFQGALVDFGWTVRRTFVEPTSNFRRAVVECSSNFCRASVKRPLTFRQSPTETLPKINQHKQEKQPKQ